MDTGASKDDLDDWRTQLKGLWKATTVVNEGIILGALFFNIALGLMHPVTWLVQLMVIAMISLSDFLQAAGYVSRSFASVFYPIIHSIPLFIATLTTGGYYSPFYPVMWSPLVMAILAYAAPFFSRWTSLTYHLFLFIRLNIKTLILCLSDPEKHPKRPIIIMAIIFFVQNLVVFAAFDGYITIPQFPSPKPGLAFLSQSSFLAIAYIGRAFTFRKVAHWAILREKHANEAKSRFLSDVSHEIRTPLTTILGWTDLLLIAPDTLNVNGTLKIVKHSSEHLLSIINDLLDLSKVENGRLTLKNKPFNLTVTISKIIESCRILVRPNVRLINDSHLPEDLILTGDCKRVSQILQNFLSNAAKFTEKGEISLTCEMGKRKEDRLVEVNFALKDSGIGMTAEAISRIFKPFNQADTTAFGKFGGTGLGLSITKQLIEAMSGSVQIRSVPREGSTFSWNLWLKEADVDSAPSCTIDPPIQEQLFDSVGPTGVCNTKYICGPSEPIRVLLCEDNKFNQQMIKLLLEREGCEVTTADNGQDALGKFQNCQEIDLIIMDIQMPIRDGISATEELRKLGCNTKIYGLTANVEPRSLQLGRDAGMDKVFTKPLRQSDVTKMLQNDGSEGAKT